MAKIYLGELSAVLAEKHGVDRRAAQRFVNSVVDVIHQGLEKDRMVKVRGLGTFKIVDVEARKSVNVNTGEEVLIDGHSKLTFLPETSLKELVNKPFALFETVLLNEGVSFSELDDEEEEMDIDNGDESAPAPEVEKPIVKVVQKVKPVVEEEAPVIEEPVQEEAPVVEEVEAPVIVEEETPVIVEPVQEMEPVVEEEEAPVIVEPVQKEAPVVVEEEKPVIVEPVQEEEPVIEEVEAPVIVEPVQEEEPVVEEVEAPVIVEPVQEVEAPAASPLASTDEQSYTDEPSYDDEEDEEPETRRRINPVLAVAILLLTLLVGGGVGYLVGRNVFGSSTPTETVAEQTVTRPAEVIKAPTEDPAEPQLEVTQVEVSEPEVSEPANEQKPEKAVVPAPQSTALTTEEPIWEKYNAMDARLRNGFYYITGLDRMEKVKAGDNVARISKRVFGAVELACYIEVFNGIDARTELVPDTEIKIPKIESKKHLRRRLQQQNNQ